MGQRGFRKVPARINVAIAALSPATFNVGATKWYSFAALAAGELDHLQISANGTALQITSPVLPSTTRGRSSRWNVEGRVIVRRDLPKIHREYGWDSPNFGDWSRGSHWVAQTREIFQRETIYGRSLPILVDQGRVDPTGVTLGFRVDQVFDKSLGYSDRDLVFALSLLQENVGVSNVVATTTSVAAWLAAQHVPWEFLPPGTRFAAVLAHFGLSGSSPRMQTMHNRYTEIMKFNPTDVIIGSSGFARYIGFKFRDDLVAFENLDYGNALYLMYEQWQTLSRRSRIDLLSQRGNGYDRIVHRAGWENFLRVRLAAAGWTP